MAEHETKSIFDREPDAAFEARLVAEAEAEIYAGKGVPQERVREWVVSMKEHYRARSAILDEMAAIDQELGLI